MRVSNECSEGINQFVVILFISILSFIYFIILKSFLFNIIDEIMKLIDHLLIVPYLATLTYYTN